MYEQSPHPNLGRVDQKLDRLELELIAGAFERDIPILAICRGMQMFAVALGGTLNQDLPSQIPGLRHEVREHGRQFLTHEMSVAPDSRLARVLGRDTVTVNSFHHQSVATMPECLRTVGWAKDGVIEAAEAPDKRFAVGVQCHPEDLWQEAEPAFGHLFAEFVGEAKRRMVESRG